MPRITPFSFPSPSVGTHDPLWSPAPLPFPHCGSCPPCFAVQAPLISHGWPPPPVAVPVPALAQTGVKGHSWARPPPPSPGRCPSVESSLWWHRASRNLRSTSSTSMAFPFDTGLYQSCQSSLLGFRRRVEAELPAQAFAEPKARVLGTPGGEKRGLVSSLKGRGWVCQVAPGQPGEEGGGGGGGVRAGTVRGWSSSQSLGMGPVLAS